MRTPDQHRRAQKSVVYNALLLFCLVLVIIQLWLFVSSLEGILDGRTAMIYPGAVASVVILAINIWMLVGIHRMDRGP